MEWATLWAIFSQTHLLTLIGTVLFEGRIQEKENELGWHRSLDFD
jgi:hypothetical protein